MLRFLDDIDMHAKREERYDDLLERILKRFREFGLKRNPTKVQYKLEEVKLFGVIINRLDIKLKGIQKTRKFEEYDKIFSTG